MGMVVYWIVVGGLDLVGIFYLGKLFFKDMEELGRCIAFWFTPDSWSWLRGEYWEDFWAELKLGSFLGIWGLVIYAEYQFYVDHLVQSVAAS